MRCLVTRPARDACRTAARLAAMGHEALCAPILDIAATDSPVPVENYDILIVTSANGAGRLPDLKGWEASVVYAVGPRTAEAVREQGAPADLRVAAGDAVSLVAMITAQQASRSVVLHLTGVDHKAEPDASLRAAGFGVFTWTAYHAAAATVLPPEIMVALAERQLDAALHYSRRSIETLIGLLGEEQRASFSQLRHFCLSEDVATPLRAFAANDIFIAGKPSEDALFGLLPPG